MLPGRKLPTGPEQLADITTEKETLQAEKDELQGFVLRIEQEKTTLEDNLTNKQRPISKEQHVIFPKQKETVEGSNKRTNYGP